MSDDSDDDQVRATKKAKSLIEIQRIQLNKLMSAPVKHTHAFTLTLTIKII
jgi:hypothetical protein